MKLPPVFAIGRSLMGFKETILLADDIYQLRTELRPRLVKA